MTTLGHSRSIILKSWKTDEVLHDMHNIILASTQSYKDMAAKIIENLWF